VTTGAARTPLSRERVLAAAMALADAEGLSALTMRRLAADVGVEAMSLYYHVPGKEGLLDGLTETVLVAINAAVAARVTADDDWRTALRHRCLAAREVMVAHRWAPGLLGSRSSIPPGLYPYYEEILATMIRGGLSYHLAHRAIAPVAVMILLCQAPRPHTRPRMAVGCVVATCYPGNRFGLGVLGPRCTGVSRCQTRCRARGGAASPASWCLVATRGSPATERADTPARPTLCGHATLAS